MLLISWPLVLGAIYSDPGIRWECTFFKNELEKKHKSRSHGALLKKNSPYFKKYLLLKKQRQKNNVVLRGQTGLMIFFFFLSYCRTIPLGVVGWMCTKRFPLWSIISSTSTSLTSVPSVWLWTLHLPWDTTKLSIGINGICRLGSCQTELWIKKRRKK